MKTKQLIFIFIVIVGTCYTQSFAEWNIPANFFAMQSHSLQGDTSYHTRTMQMMQRAGVKIIRDEMYWSNIEHEKGKIVIPDNYRQNVDITLSHNIDLLIILDYGNSLYDNGLSPHTPEGRAAFANYCYTVVSTFRGKIKYFEIWNEPNYGGFWKPQPNPEDYEMLLQEAYKACKIANPDCVILGGVTSGVDIHFLDKVFAKGGLEYMDILSLHPYRGSAPEVDDSLVNQLTKAGNLLQKYKSTKRIWITEMGYPTHKGSNGHSEEQQADYMTRSYLETLSTGMVDCFFWYWFGPDGPDETYSEDRFGLVRQNWTPKPSYLAYQTLTQYLTEATYLGKLKFKNSNIRAYQFRRKNGKKDILTAIWNIHETNPVSFESKSVNLKYIDRNGFLTNYMTFQEKFTAAATESPFYLVSVGNIVPTDKYLIKFDKDNLYSGPGGVRTLEVKLDRELSKKIAEKSNLKNKIQYETTPSEIQVEPSEMFLLNPKSPLFSTGTSIRVRVPRINPPKSGTVRSTLYLDGVPRGFIQCNITITPAIRSWIRPFMNDSTGRDGFNIYIENLSSDTLSGNVLVSSESDIILDQLTPSFSNLIGNNTTVLPIHILDRGDAPSDTLYPIDCKIIITGFDFQTVHRKIDYLTCVKATCNIVIDGKLDEWTHASLIDVGKPEQITTGKENYHGPNDFDSVVYTLWDDENLYIAAIVTDDTISSMIPPGTDVYRSDGMEVYIDTECDGDTGDMKYTSHDFQYGFFDTPKGPIVWRWSPGDQLSPNGKIAWQKRNDLGPDGNLPGYVIEGAIPFSELSTKPKSGKLLGFTISMDDDDTPNEINPFSQDKQFTWAGDKFNWTDPSKFGFLFLVK